MTLTAGSRHRRANNIIRTHVDTQALFRLDNNSYLEVVSAPFAVPGRRS